jgi:hypothetical protein
MIAGLAAIGIAGRAVDVNPPVTVRTLTGNAGSPPTKTAPADWYHANAHESGTGSSADLISKAQVLRLFVSFVNISGSESLHGDAARLTTNPHECTRIRDWQFRGSHFKSTGAAIIRAIRVIRGSESLHGDAARLTTNAHECARIRDCQFRGSDFRSTDAAIIRAIRVIGGPESQQGGAGRLSTNDANSHKSGPHLPIDIGRTLQGIFRDASRTDNRTNPH